MIRTSANICWRSGLIMAGLVVGFAGQAASVLVVTSNTPAPSLPPPPAPLRPPVEMFRSLLSMTPGERHDFLTNRPPESQKLILAKVREYEALPPDARELRLRVTELRWYLLPLLKAPLSNRVYQLSAVPDNLRGLLETRLQEWDKLPAEVQKEFLDNESTVRFLSELSARAQQDSGKGLGTNLAPAGFERLEAGMHQWESLDDARREMILRNFNQFFELTSQEKEKTLATLSEKERAQIQKTLVQFDSLTPSQRAQCIRSFQKFASLSPQDRQQFLKNAARWEQMSPGERQSWRNLVDNLYRQPPLPPGLNAPPAPSRPIPSALNPPGKLETLLTNTN